MHLSFATFFPWGLRADMNKSLKKKKQEEEHSKYVELTSTDKKLEVIALQGLCDNTRRHESSDVAFSKSPLGLKKLRAIGFESSNKTKNLELQRGNKFYGNS